MPEISRRAVLTQASPIRKLKPLADQALKAGKKIYNLNIGQPDIPTPKAFMAGVQTAPAVLAYSPSQGVDEALEALVDYYENHDIKLSKEDLIITVGGSEAVMFALLAVTDPRDEILIPEPFYTNYNSYAQMAGIEIIPIETRAEEGFRLPNKAAIESKISIKTRAILMCNPGNPTGVVYTKTELEMLKELALTHNLFLISDEVYREFVYDGLKHVSVLHLRGLEEHAILVDSISKRFSACGARIGALASKNKAVMEAALKFAQARLSPPSLGQLGLIQLLRSSTYRQEVAQMISEFEKRRDLVYAQLQKIAGVICRKPQGAFYIIAKLPVKDAEAFCKWLLTDFSLDGETVLLAPAADFYKQSLLLASAHNSTPGKGKDEVRIAYVLNREALKKAMRILREGLQAYTVHHYSDSKNSLSRL